MQLIRQPKYDLKQRPFMVIWETTQACDLACRHYRKEHHANNLSLNVRGGSRSRAYAMTRDVLAEEPFCDYQPGSFPFSNQIAELAEAA